MTDLANKTCVPCRGGTPPLEGEPLEEPSRQLPGWEVVEGHHLRRGVPLRELQGGAGFREPGRASWPRSRPTTPTWTSAGGDAGITIFTHKIDGLTESDFVLAAKVDRLYPA